ncbi:glycosyltransferase involved in cell wall biosynthesis [Sphingomonas sp. PP-F2F-G114-C0414]|uniref:glycosyltransferase family 2 protein n=1 Tax=Sphingomonas sp. PP-F2F-G114-C0414 TaxID=2135662 RepID=UPI000EF9128B|nr:glycosyltransferase family A protein [Sphingomonas sp. PP-F2F-G114-C0414]RMB25698.1 glycosyltransferase involved in cell wall biosynthesis [Sphingomonas sp. PP-F2F-G114-C0414]
MTSTSTMPDDSVVATAKPPLLTFCIMAFNQEQFVETAMRAVFAQTYKNLEIIVSDDGSSDGTMRRMEAVAATYEGPHRLVVRRSPTNRGVLHHLLDIAELASGSLLIVSAADDVSLPRRTEVMATAWSRQPYAAAFADYAVIDDIGTIIDDHYRFDDSGFSPQDYIPETKGINIHGASSVYDIEQLKALGRPRDDEMVLFEDTWLGLAFASMGARIAHVPDVLVQYRRHSGALTNFESAAGTDREAIERADREWQRRSAAFGTTLDSFRRWHGRQAEGEFPLSNRIDRDIAYFDRVGRWSDLSTSSRLMTFRFASRRWMKSAVGIRVLPMIARTRLQQLRQTSKAR